MSAPGYAQSDLPPGAEQEIMASYIYTLAKFVKWPARSFSSAGDPLIICTLGEDPVAQALERIVEGKTINGRALTFRRLAEPQNLDRCHILFVGSSEDDHLELVLSRLHGSSVMTFGESERFVQLGGIVRLRMHEAMVRSEVNMPAARRGDLRISSDFLKLSGIVTVRTPEGD